jgi:phage tail-like protein
MASSFAAGASLLPRIFDHLQNFPFWIMDMSASGFGGNAFTPLLGFSTCTSPEITLEMADIREGNWFYPHHHVKAATVSSITLTRGVQFYDSDFYKWLLMALQGQGVVKRDLILIHYFNISPITLAAQAAKKPGIVPSLIANVGVGGLMQGKILRAMPVQALGRYISTDLTAQSLAALNLVPGFNSPVEFAPRFPAKAWMLRGCVPMRWKSTSDFDATSGDVSIAELEIQPHYIEELSVSKG